MRMDINPQLQAREGHDSVDTAVSRLHFGAQDTFRIATCTSFQII
jgi:hypothetical protein